MGNLPFGFSNVYRSGGDEAKYLENSLALAFLFCIGNVFGTKLK
jgi:hypothetical protein